MSVSLFCVYRPLQPSSVSCELRTDSSEDSLVLGWTCVFSIEDRSCCLAAMAGYGISSAGSGFPPPEFRGTHTGVPSDLTHCVVCDRLEDRAQHLMSRGHWWLKAPRLRSFPHSIPPFACRIPFCLSSSIIGIHRPSVLIAQLVFAGAFDTERERDLHHPFILLQYTIHWQYLSIHCEAQYAPLKHSLR